MTEKGEQLRQRILDLVTEYTREAFPARKFSAGCDPVPVSGKVFDEAEMRLLVDSSLDFWLTEGRYAARFEREFAGWMGVRQCLLVNSGSSANLVALSALTSPRLGERRLRPGDEVITVAAGFPTTVNPILQNGLVPVFVDVTLPTYNVDTSQLEAALSPRTRAMIFAHTLGNPFDLDAVASFAQTHDLWLVEDCCDAVGSTYFGRKTGTFGDLATVSFYPAHHMTMGEGGAVLTNTPLLHTIAESFRDWGRDCWCEPGCDNTCGKRFNWHLGDLPSGYDHKYTYSHIGYNLKLTDMQAAVGVAQLEKLDGFVEARRRNFQSAARRPGAAWRSFSSCPKPPSARNRAGSVFRSQFARMRPFSRNQVTRYLEDRKIATRLLFGGNLTRQPAYRESRYRVVGSLSQTDIVMNQVFWIGLYPGIGPAALEYMLEALRGARSLAAPVGV